MLRIGVARSTSQGYVTERIGVRKGVLEYPALDGI